MLKSLPYEWSTNKIMMCRWYLYNLTLVRKIDVVSKSKGLASGPRDIVKIEQPMALRTYNDSKQIKQHQSCIVLLVTLNGYRRLTTSPFNTISCN